MTANFGYIQRLSEGFVAEPQSVPAARRAAESVRGVLGSRICVRVCLLVSEVVTSAISSNSRHSTRALRMRVWTSPTTVRVAVSGRGAASKPRERPRRGELAVDGWGIYLLDRFADRWGVRRGRRPEVWFEIDRESRL